MLIREQPPLHLTYCLNIHPGESWAENFKAIRDDSLRVKERVCPGRPFGLGLRLSRAAADSLSVPARRSDVRRFLDDHGLYVFTINGFPYGRFHGGAVKENVYAPDWRTAERLEYTAGLGEILADLLPPGVSGSISTVPGSFKPWIQNSSDVKAMAAALTECARRLAVLRERTGKDLCLALEPEPGCFLETTEEVLRFFREDLLSGDAAADQALGRHLGVCVDTCHAAVQFEDPAAALGRYRDAGIRVGKVQLSAALESPPDPLLLAPYAEPVYLHQVRGRREDGSMVAWRDLPEALSDPRGAEILRVHYHVPLYLPGRDGLRSTAATLTPEFFRLLSGGVTENVEIETYTFDLLPGDQPDVVTSIAREFEWVTARLK